MHTMIFLGGAATRQQSCAAASGHCPQSSSFVGVLLPQPYGVNAAHLLGYLSPITEGELDEAKLRIDGSLNGASKVGRAGGEKQYDK